MLPLDHDCMGFCNAVKTGRESDISGSCWNSAVTGCSHFRRSQIENVVSREVGRVAGEHRMWWLRMHVAQPPHHHLMQETTVPTSRHTTLQYGSLGTTTQESASLGDVLLTYHVQQYALEQLRPDESFIALHTNLYNTMASAAGSDIFVVAAYLTISLAVLLLLRHFVPLRTTPSFVTLPVFLAVALPASIILLVPIDLASGAKAADESSKGIWLNERVMLVLWRISYWLTFILTWVALPLLGEYMDAGYREPKNRLLYSLRSNGRYQLIVLASSAAGLVYMILSNGFNFMAIKGLVMALAYVWGLILAIYLMGHGLVAVPRRMFRNADISGRLRRVQSQAPKIHDKLEDALTDLRNLELQVQQLKQRETGSGRDFRDWIDDLVDNVGMTGSRISYNPILEETAPKVPTIITDRYLADLSRRLGRARQQRARYEEAWDDIVQTASSLQSILDSKTSRKLDFGNPSPSSAWFSRFSILTPYLRFHLHAHLIPFARISLGSILALASLAIIWSEIIRFPAPQLSAVSLTVIHHPNDDNYQIGLGGQFLASAWICYMCACALISVNDVPVWGQRALVRRHTHSESACWYAGQIAKLTVPLSYNFLTFLPQHIRENTTFYRFLGKLINLTPLGTGFDYFFPIFILVPVLAALFNVYGKVKRWFGFDILEDEDEDAGPSGSSTRGWREGRDLIARDLQGSGTTSIGLNDSPRPSNDISRSGLNAPTRWVPPAEWNTSQGDEPAARSGGSRRSRPALDPEPDEENFFTLFGRRVKNTIDTIDTPKWMQKTSTGPLKVPKWMSKGQSSNTDDRGTSAGTASNGRTLGSSLFASRADEGQITI